jgi:iron complex outermembrane recepter protein
MKNTFFTLSILFICKLAFGQLGTLKGTVTNSDGQAAPYVSIQLKEIKKGVNSNDRGEFLISNITPDTYTLVASFVGYKTLEQKVNIEEGKTLNLSLELHEKAETLKEIVVKGYVSQNERVVSVGKIPIRVMDLPQSIMTIDKTTLDNQQVLRISDVLMNTNGVYISGTTGGYQEEISGRGFSFGSSNTFKNGIRYFNGMLTEMSGIERVEVMKGSSAILFGNVAAGGILNLVTKKPKFDFGGEMTMRLGSFGLLKPSFDVYGGIGKGQTIAYRLNASYEKADSFRKGVSSERIYVNPSFLIKMGKKTDVLIEADYLNDNRTPDFGGGIVNYQIVDIPREKFIGLPWSYFKSEQLSTTATISHRFTENWKLNATGAYRNYNTDLFSNTRPNTGTLINSEGMWIRNVQRSKVAEDYYLGQADLIGNITTGKVSHQILVGMDTDHFKTFTTAYTQLSRYDTLNIFGTKQYKVRNDVPDLSLATLTTAPVDRVGAYVQDLIGLTSKIKLLAGLRYSYQQTQSDVYNFNTKVTTSTIFYDGAFSPRFGLVYQPTKKHSAFASYSNSFTLNTGVDIKGNALPPSFIDQYELGIKNELLNGRISANITLYRILNSNLAQTSLANGNTNTNIRELAGSVQSEGVELDIVARPLVGLNLMAGYSYNETKYVKSNTFIEGSFLRYNPNHTANASAHYRFESSKLKGLSMGLNGVYIGTRYAGRSTRVQVANDAYRIIELSGFTQIDGSMSYTIKNISIRAKIGNIFDALSYNVHDDNSVNPIAPRNYSLTLDYHF